MWTLSAVRRSGPGAPTHGARPADDPAPIQVGLDRPVPRPRGPDRGDGPRDPVDVGGLERGDLAERMAVELAEPDDRGRRASSEGGGGPPEVAHAARTSGPVGVRARGGSRSTIATRSGGWPGRIVRRVVAAVARRAWLRGRYVAARVDAAGHRSGRLGRGRRARRRRPGRRRAARRRRIRLPAASALPSRGSGRRRRR